MIITEWDKGLACSSIIEVIFNVQYVFYLNRMNFSKFYQCTSPYAISRILVGTEKLILYLNLRWHEMCHKIGSRQYQFFFSKSSTFGKLKKKPSIFLRVEWTSYLHYCDLPLSSACPPWWLMFCSLNCCVITTIMVIWLPYFLNCLWMWITRVEKRIIT